MTLRRSSSQRSAAGRGGVLTGRGAARAHARRFGAALRSHVTSVDIVAGADSDTASAAVRSDAVPAEFLARADSGMASVTTAAVDEPI